MTPSDFVRGAINALGWAASDVTLYPVRASDVAAYLGAGLSGTAAKGVMEVRPVISTDGEVGVAGELVSLKIDNETAESIVARRWSLAYGSSLYDILRKGPSHPGGVDLHLQEYR
jgi:hypothetical protein